MRTMRFRPAHGAPVYSTAEIRSIENQAVIPPGSPSLMERAGAAAAEMAQELAARNDSGRQIVIFAGPGNNGGDALVVARLLRELWFDVAVVSSTDPSRYPPDAALAWRAWADAGGTTIASPPPLSTWKLAVDGIFGIGLTRDISGTYAEWVSLINRFDGPRLALDIPSGLASDSGRRLGPVVSATDTITFIGLKPGLLTLDGPDCCGTIAIANLDLPHTPGKGALLTASCLAALLPQRQRNSHKGTYGSVGIVGGADGMVGAAILTGRAALLGGAGRVYCGLLATEAPLLDSGQPELMLRRAAEIFVIQHLNCLALGPGLGTSGPAMDLARQAATADLPLVVDADGLNLAASDINLMKSLATRHAPTLLTPHPAEAARLLACATADIQNDRVAAAVALARRMNAGVVVKGNGSICAFPSGHWHINTTGNPGMAAAGMGDVLTGIIASLLSQGILPEAALPGGVCLHGAAADEAVSSGKGPIGLTATEVSVAARRLLNTRVS